MALLVLGAWHCWERAVAETGDDFYHFWIVPPAVRELGLRDVYRPAGRLQIARAFLAASDGFGPRAQRAARENAALYPEHVLPTATPFLYALHAGLRSGDYERDYLLFQAVSGLAFVLGLLSFANWVGLSPALAASLTGLALLGHAGLGQDVATANTNRLQVGLLALALGLLCGPPSRWAAGGLLAGLAVAYKPNLALAVLLPLWAWAAARRWRRCRLVTMGLASGLAVAFAAGSLFFGSRQVWVLWARQIPTGASMRSIGLLDYSLGSLVTPWLGSGVALPLLALLLTGAGLVLARAARVDGHDLLWPAAGVGLALPVLCGPLTWNHYFVLTLPLFAWLLRPSAPEGQRLAAGLGLLLTAWTPWAWLLGDLPPLIEAAAMQAGLLLGLGLAATQLLDWNPTRPTAQAQGERGLGSGLP